MLNTDIQFVLLWMVFLCNNTIVSHTFWISILGLTLAFIKLAKDYLDMQGIPIMEDNNG